MCTPLLPVYPSLTVSPDETDAELAARLVRACQPVYVGRIDDSLEKAMVLHRYGVLRKDRTRTLDQAIEQACREFAAEFLALVVESRSPKT